METLNPKPLHGPELGRMNDADVKAALCRRSHTHTNRTSSVSGAADGGGGGAATM